MVWSEMAFDMIAVVTEDEGRLMLTFYAAVGCDRGHA